MNIPTITVHSKDDCPYCEEAKAFLIGKSIPFAETKHNDDTDRQALYDRLGLAGNARTIPQIVLHDLGYDYLIGGAHAVKVSGIESLFPKPAALGQKLTTPATPAGP